MPAMRDAIVNRRLRGFRQLAVLVLLAASFMLAAPQPADAYRKKSHAVRTHHRRLPEPDRYSSIVIDANTGYVLSEKDAEVRRFPASLSKMMTLYLVFEALENGTVTKNQRLPISANAEYQEPSKLGLQEGYTIRLEDAIYGVVTRSANDAAVTLAEGIGGSESHFARLMTFKAQQLGMRASASFSRWCSSASTRGSLTRSKPESSKIAIAWLRLLAVRPPKTTPMRRLPSRTAEATMLYPEAWT